MSDGHACCIEIAYKHFKAIKGSLGNVFSVCVGV